jgi:hypothetical protein
MSVVGAPRSAGLVARVTGILLRPNTEWDVIDQEQATVPGLFMGYAALLAAIPAVAGLIGSLLIGMLIHAFVTIGNPAMGMIDTIVGALLGYVLSLASVFILGFVINALAASFGSTPNLVQAMKVAVYSATPAWVAGVFLFIPVLGNLIHWAGAVYSLVLIFFGVAKVMKPPADKAAVYAIVAIVLDFLLVVVAATVVFVVHTTLSVAGGALAVQNQTVSGTVNVNGGSIDLGKLQQAGQQLEQQAQAAQNGGGAASGQIVAVDPAKLKALLPDNVAGAPRTDLTSTTAGNQAVSTIEATYGAGDTHVTITITDLGAASGLAALASAVNVTKDEETSTGYDREGQVNGRMTIEKYDNTSKSGEYSVIVANRFSVEAQGSGVPIDTLKGAVNAVGPDRLDALAHGG